MKKITICTDKNKLNLNFIHDFISNSYWGRGRTIEDTKKIIYYSLNFGIYLNENQIGYARVITDYTILAYLLDVFITESKRGNGYSLKLMDCIMNHPDLKNIRSWKLATIDAQGLYRKYGFELIKSPDMMGMKR